MAMNPTILSPALVASLKAKARAKNSFIADLLDNPDANIDWVFETMAEAVAEEVILHIQTAGVVNTVVTPGVPPAPSTGLGTVT